MNILLVTMEMQVGGAETHLFELAQELKKRGNNVYVMSAGGKYAEALKENNIEHIYAPLKNKKPQNMLKSYEIIKKVIEDKSIDVVHAHARIPAFIAGLVCKKLKKPLVTTIHGIYKINFIFKLLTNWGEKSLAVSEDIRKQVMRDYNIKGEDIKVTVNGINTDAFCKGEKLNIRNEFKLAENSFNIVHVSRIDEMSSNVSKLLIDAMGELNKKINNKINLIIVGDGNDFSNISKIASAHNNVIMTGLRTDVSDILKECDLFVGVSRAALEAMSSELPVILAGNKDYGQGYIGIFDETKLSKAIETNFCFRGCEEVTKENLIEDIVRIYNMSLEDRDKLGAFGRDVVNKYYSINKMANDAENMYKEVIKGE